MSPLHMETWESEVALLRHLDSTEGTTLVVGDEAEAPREFYSCHANFESTVVEVGVISSGLGSAPAVVVVGGGRTLLVGHDMWLTRVNVPKGRVESERRLGGVFFEFRPVDDDDVVVVHELGAFRVSGNGEEQWNIDTDVVENFRIEPSGTLVLSIMDEPEPVVVDLATGRSG